LSTVRIYKVAELLGLSSQDAMTLLKQDTGIDVKSASSSIEEIVARQFVERHAKKRNIVLPGGALFADAPAAKKSGKAKAAPEPQRPAAPALPAPCPADRSCRRRNRGRSSPGCRRTHAQYRVDP